ncbi:MAG: SGNH/GDSL hydrolase family protein [Rhodoglobus sp.]
MAMRRLLAATLGFALLATLSGCASDDSAVISPDTVISPDSSATRVAFYGDSYTLGTGASDPAQRWSTIISTERGWSEFNPSTNGLGFVNNRRSYGDGDEPSQVIADDPAILFVTMGLNDNFSYETAAAKIKSQITADFTRLKTALPDARIIVVEPFWYTDERPASVGIIMGWVKDAAASIGADYISGASHWIEGHPEWMAADGLHPNDEGYAAMAVQMDAALKKLGL